jgi:serine-type D-Ala-D-Ala carboxypeptidase (penicillin-binding protein 5/6)
MLKAILFTLLLSASLSLYSKQLDVQISAKSAILINAQTGAVLYEKEAYTPAFPASVTKIATALYTLKMKRDALDEMITASPQALATVAASERQSPKTRHPPYRLEFGGTHMGIKVGERLSLKDLIYGLMLVSANDAANVIAEHISGDIPTFMEGVNGYLKSIGCSQTTFYSPHGLAFPQHKTTAYDLARMTQEALKDPFFRQVVGSKNFERPTTNKQEAIVLRQGNRLLHKGPYYYPKAIGVKTGYTASSGTTLVAAAEEEGRTLIVVLLGYTDGTARFKDAVALFETAFSQPLKSRTLFTQEHDTFKHSLKKAKTTLQAQLSSDLKLEYYPAEEPEFKAFLSWYDAPLPIKKGTLIGEIKVLSKNGSLLTSAPLLAKEDVELKSLYALGHFFERFIWILPVKIALLLLLFSAASLLYVKRKKAV